MLRKGLDRSYPRIQSFPLDTPLCIPLICRSSRYTITHKSKLNVLGDILNATLHKYRVILDIVEFSGNYKVCCWFVLECILQEFATSRNALSFVKQSDAVN